MTPLESFVREHLGDVEILPTPVVRGATRMLRVRDASGGEWYAKRLLDPDAWRAEAGAYALWGDLPAVPTLAASSAERQALLVPALPGGQPHHRHRPALRAAGQVLRGLHACAPPDDWRSTWREQVADGVEGRLRLLAAGTSVDADQVRDALRTMLDLELPEVATHGDYQPHNWRWHRGRLAVFDFGAAGLRPAAWDLARLRVGACWADPGGWEALLSGYGRDLTAAEQSFVEASMPWRALVAVTFGLRHGKPRLVAHGTAVLAALQEGRTWGRAPLRARVRSRLGVGAVVPGRPDRTG